MKKKDIIPIRLPEGFTALIFPDAHVPAAHSLDMKAVHRLCRDMQPRLVSDEDNLHHWVGEMDSLLKGMPQHRQGPLVTALPTFIRLVNQGELQKARHSLEEAVTHEVEQQTGLIVTIKEAPPIESCNGIDRFLSAVHNHDMLTTCRSILYYVQLLLEQLTDRTAPAHDR